MARLLTLLALTLVLLSPTVTAKNAVFSTEIAMTEKWTDPQSVVVFPARFTNHARSATALTFTVVNVEGRLQAVTPNPVTLEEGENASVPFTIQAPYQNGHMDERGTATYRVATAGVEEEFTFVVHTKGFYVPGPQMFGALAALGLAALVLRRLRSR